MFASGNDAQFSLCATDLNTETLVKVDMWPPLKGRPWDHIEDLLMAGEISSLELLLRKRTVGLSHNGGSLYAQSYKGRHKKPLED
jgi:hypothetical protein